MAERVSDVLILGGGIIGCAAAEVLARRGAAVTLLEPRDIGQGASRASAGMLAPFNEGRHDPVLLTLGERSLALYDGFVASAAQAGDPVPYVRSGSLDVAFDDAAAAGLREVRDQLHARGVACEWLDPRALRDSEPLIGSAAVGGLRIDEHGYVGVPELVDALWRRAEQAGARRVAGQARRLRTESARLVRVETDNGWLESPHVVLAAGCWAGGIDIGSGARLPVRPVKGQLIALGWDARPLGRTLWGPRCYAVPWTDGTLLVGATTEEVGFDERPTADGVQALLAAVCELAPRARSAFFAGVRVGLRPGTPDDRPIVGPSSRIPGLVYATGHYRNGALLAPITAAAIADMVEGLALDAIWRPCSPDRFGTF
jgi:glycine oxidase